jgi:copper(I)-binding protein
VAGDRLVGAGIPKRVAARVELHEVVTDARGGMTMRRVEGIPLPPGTPVRLRPGAFHLMLVDLAASLADGDTIDVTLRFERAPDATVRVPVRRR